MAEKYPETVFSVSGYGAALTIAFREAEEPKNMRRIISTGM